MLPTAKALELVASAFTVPAVLRKIIPALAFDNLGPPLKPLLTLLC